VGPAHYATIACEGLTGNNYICHGGKLIKANKKELCKSQLLVFSRSLGKGSSRKVLGESYQVAKREEQIRRVTMESQRENDFGWSLEAL